MVLGKFLLYPKTFKITKKTLGFGKETVTTSYKLFKISLIIFILYKLGLIDKKFLLSLPAYLKPILNYIQKLFAEDEYVRFDDPEINGLYLRVSKGLERLSAKLRKKINDRLESGKGYPKTIWINFGRTVEEGSLEAFSDFAEQILYGILY